MAEPPGRRKAPAPTNSNNHSPSTDSPISYAAAVSSFLIRHDLSSIPVMDVAVSIRQPQWKEGKHAVVLSPLVLQRSEAPLQYALIAKFSKSRPRMDVIRYHISTKWGLLAIPIVSFIDRRHILIKLQNAEDFSKAWTRDSHSIEGSLFRLFKWSRDFKATEESPVTPKEEVTALLSKLDLQNITFAESRPGDANQSVLLVVGEGLEAYLPLADMVDIPAESKHLAKMQIEYDGLVASLSSPSFIEKAPEEIVQGGSRKSS